MATSIFDEFRAKKISKCLVLSNLIILIAQLYLLIYISVDLSESSQKVVSHVNIQDYSCLSGLLLVQRQNLWVLV